MVLSASQMLGFFGHEDLGKKLIDCIEALLAEKKTLTPDLGGTAFTSEAGDAIVGKLKSIG